MNINITSLIKEENSIVEKKGGLLYIHNRKNEEVEFKIKKIFLNLKKNKLQFKFIAKDIYNGNCMIEMRDRTDEVLHAVHANEMIFIEDAPRIYKFVLKIQANTDCILKDIIIEEFNSSAEGEFYSFYDSDNLLIAPGYPTLDNKYYWAFIHTRMKLYKENGLNFKLVIAQSAPDIRKLEYDGIEYFKVNFYYLRELLQKKTYKILAVHYLSDEVLQTLKSISISKTQLYIYCHSADLIYRDTHKLGTKYFHSVDKINSSEEERYQHKDNLIHQLNERSNVTFVFNTKWAKETSEKENGIVYKNSMIIPCPINESVFQYSKKHIEKRKNIVIVRKFDNINTYGIDLNVKCILELSKRDFFDDLTFDIYGDGNYHDVLLAPLKQFDNVHIHHMYLSQQEMKEVYEKVGIALFGTRYETQGVAASEAAISGVIVITNDVCAVSESIPKDMLCAEEDYLQMADKVDYYYHNIDAFTNDSARLSKYVQNFSGLKQSLNVELDEFSKTHITEFESIKFEEPNENPVLTVIVPSYNAHQWLQHGIESLALAKNANQLEVLIVNDGSKDNTKKIGESLEKWTTVNGKSIVKVIDKENGGHGSTINAGIKYAKGKYIKVMDSDDYFDTFALEKLIDILKNENSDLILTDYVEDWSSTANYVYQKYYKFMEEGKQYNIEDLCYAGYGFNRYANILHTSTFKTKMLKDAGFKISEKCFYVDMELNTYSFMLAKTVTYYSLDLYIYYLGRAGQSVSPEAFKKNYKQHEHVLLKIINEIDNQNDLSYAKKQCLYRTIVLPMIETQYYILTEYLQDIDEFKLFDDKIKKHQDLYNDKFILKGKTIEFRKRLKSE